ncbi:hypothetical protein [Neorhodopirellula lusitana]|uniref:hypothetical protein n=1 Tax=Neorhodopirellula lusitana TaxID=445327 RepID=UPI00384BAA8F
MHGILIEGDNNKWYESGAVGDVTIRHNVFHNVGFEGGAKYPLLAAPLLTSSQRMGEGQYHRNIRFVDNTIESFNGLIVQAKSVSGLVIENNEVKFSADYPAGDSFPAIDLNYCDDVSIRGNQVDGFGRKLDVKVSADTTNVIMEANPRFQTE